MTLIVVLVLSLLVVGLGGGGGALVSGRRQPKAPPRQAPSGTILEEERPSPATEEPLPGPPVPTLERPEGTASRLVRLRQRLARSQGGLGRSLLALLSRDRLDESTWEDIEDTLLTADVGVGPTQELVERLRTRMRGDGVSARDAGPGLRGELLPP